MEYVLGKQKGGNGGDKLDIYLAVFASQETMVSFHVLLLSVLQATPPA